MSNLEEQQATHKCPKEGCEAQLPHEILMCRRHWHDVPVRLKHKVTAAWRAKDWPVYLRAREAAVAAVNGK
jgi:hypothetical protein